MYTIARSAKGRKQLMEAREKYRQAYTRALDTDDQAAMDRARICMRQIDAAIVAAKLDQCEVRMVAQDVDFTGKFYVTYWDVDTETTRTVNLELRETFEHINRRGWPSSIGAELQSGGAAAAQLKVQRDHDYNGCRYSIWTYSGIKVAEEVMISAISH